METEAIKAIAAGFTTVGACWAGAWAFVSYMRIEGDEGKALAQCEAYRVQLGQELRSRDEALRVADVATKMTEATVKLVKEKNEEIDTLQKQLVTAQKNLESCGLHRHKAEAKLKELGHPMPLMEG